MSSIKLESNASGTGIFTIASPNSNTNRTLTLPDNTGTILTGSSAITRSQLPAGSVLQVVQATSTTATATTSTSFVSCGLSASITPSSASNKVLVLFSTAVFKESGNAHGITTIFRGTVAGTNLGHVNWGFGANYAAAEECTSTNTGAILDSPSTTSSQTYTIGLRTNTGVSVQAQANSGMGVITLMEIAA